MYGMWFVLKHLGSLSSASAHDHIPYLETVRRQGEWESLGYKVRLDKYGFPVKRAGQKLYFQYVGSSPDSLLMAAAGTGKKAIQHPMAVLPYYLAGCGFDEFFELPRDVRAFCLASKARREGKLPTSILIMTEAVRLNPDEVRYREALYEDRLATGDLSAIREEFEFFRSDMDALVHTGRAQAWIKALVLAGLRDEAKRLADEVVAALIHLESGSQEHRHYAGQSPEFCAAKRVAFTKSIPSLMRRQRKFDACAK